MSDIARLRAIADALKPARKAGLHDRLASVADDLRHSLSEKAMADRPAHADPERIREEVERVVAGLEVREGPIGPMPRHEWKNTSLRFEEEPGVWGKWVDLQGPKGDPGLGGGVGIIKQQVAGNSWFPGGW